MKCSYPRDCNILIFLTKKLKKLGCDFGEGAFTIIVRSSTRWARRPSLKSSRIQNLGLLWHLSWASGCLGHANTPRGLPKYEVTKRLGGADMRSAPRLGAPVPRDTMIDEHMGSFG
jgi:hypothetical protein